MKIVFFGSSNFGLSCLEAVLKKGHSIKCVITASDKRRGRGLKIGINPIKEFALKNGLLVFQPDNVNSNEARAKIRELSADLFIVVAYGQIFSESLLNLAPQGSFNIHASLLPKYRGAAPIAWALINGEKITGVTMFRMIKKMDAGPILLQQGIDIQNDDNALTLGKKLSILASEVLIQGLEILEKNKAPLFVYQDDKEASYAPLLKKDNGKIDWSQPASKISCLIRGCYGWPGAFTYWRGMMVKILKAKEKNVSFSLPPGQIVEVRQDALLVACGEQALEIYELQVEGRRSMLAREFICGYRPNDKDRFGSKNSCIS